MSKEVDIEYPNYEDDVSVQFPNNPNPVKLSTPNLLIGISNLYKVLFFHILILTILLFFLYKVVQQPVQSFSLYFIYPHLNIRYNISQSLTIKYLLSWIPMIYIFMKTREYHEKNWNSSSLIPAGWDPFQREVGVTIIEDLKSRYQYILMIIIVSLGFALFNLFIFLILLILNHFVIIVFPTVLNFGEFHFTMLFFRITSKALVLSRFGLAPMFIIRGEKSILTSLKSSKESTEDDPLLLFPILIILQFLTYLSPILFGILNYLLIASAFYLLHPHEFPRGRIWPLSSISYKG